MLFQQEAKQSVCIIRLLLNVKHYSLFIVDSPVFVLSFLFWLFWLSCLSSSFCLWSPWFLGLVINSCLGNTSSLLPVGGKLLRCWLGAWGRSVCGAARLTLHTCLCTSPMETTLTPHSPEEYLQKDGCSIRASYALFVVELLFITKCFIKFIIMTFINGYWGFLLYSRCEWKGRTADNFSFISEKYWKGISSLCICSFLLTYSY